MVNIKKNFKIEYLFTLIVFFILCVPYLGDTLYNFYFKLGKYYYAIATCILVLLCLYLFLTKNSNYNNLYGNLDRKDTIFFVFILIASVVFMFYTTILVILERTDLNNLIFFVIVASFLVSFSAMKHDKNLFKILSWFCFAILIIFTFISLFNKNNWQTNFNPNTYAFFVTCLSIFIVIGCSEDKTLIKIIKYVILFAISIYLVKKTYFSETELISLIAFILFLLLSKLIFLNRTLFIVVFSGVLFFSISFAFISYFLIKNGVLTESFITYRGKIWVKIIDQLKVTSIFNTVDINFDPHNGFLYIIKNYSLFLSVIFIGIFYSIILKLYSTIKANKFCQNMFLGILTILIANSVECMFFGLQYAYFIYILIGMILSQYFIDIKLKKKKQDKTI